MANAPGLYRRQSCDKYQSVPESEKSHLLTVQKTHIHASVAPSRREPWISNRPLLQLVGALLSCSWVLFLSRRYMALLI